MSFNYSYSLDGSPQCLAWFVIGNSKTVAVGEFVRDYAAVGLDNGAAAVPVLGIVTAISEGALPTIKGAFVPGTASTSDLQSVVTASDNVTTKKYWAQVDVNKRSVYSVSVTGTLGTTATSPTSAGLKGGWIDGDSAGTAYGKVLETTHTRTVATATNFAVLGTDPDDATRLLVTIAMSELDKDLE